MIKLIKDVDIYEHLNKYDVILVGTNVYCTMSQGLQLQLMLNYPYVYNKNLGTKYGDIEKMGTLLECKEYSKPTICLCFITKGYNFRPDLENDYLSYESLAQCLYKINIIYKNRNIACPLLGSSKFDGNGNKDKIYKMFNDILTDVNVTIYDYEQKSRSEMMKEVREKELEIKKQDRKKYYEIVAKRKKEAEERYLKNGHRRY